MKRAILFIVLIILSLFLHIPDYVELNDLAIIEGIGISYENNHYTIYLKELIPVKDDQGIKYQYRYYYDNGDSVLDAYQKIALKAKKKIYLDKIKFMITNLETSEELKKELNIHCKKVYHTNDDIYKKLKKTN